MKARVKIVKIKILSKSRKQNVKVHKKDVVKPATRTLLKTIEYTEGRAPVGSALIEEKVDRKFSGRVKTANDKFFDYIEGDAGKHIALALCVIFICAVAYWMIKQ